MLNIKAKVSAIPATLPPPATMQDLLDLCARYMVLTGDTNGRECPFYIGAGGPAINTVPANSVFAQTDANGRPMHLWTIFNKTWHPLYANFVGKLAWFVGLPATYFDSTGLGLVNGRWWGWALANGRNGTRDYNGENRFIVPAENSSIYCTFTYPDPDSEVSHTIPYGGAIQIRLGPNKIPNLNLPMTTQNFEGGGGRVGVVAAGFPGADEKFEYPVEPSPQTRMNLPISILPPYKAAAVVQFIGY